MSEQELPHEIVEKWSELQRMETEQDHLDDQLINRRHRFRSSQDGLERRQFSSNYSELSPAGAELGRAVDAYKLANRRRYVTYDEILGVLEALGYQKREDAPTAVPQASLEVASPEATTLVSPINR